MKKSMFTPSALRQVPLEILVKAYEVIQHRADLIDSCTTRKSKLINYKVMRMARIQAPLKDFVMWFSAEMGDYIPFYEKYPKEKNIQLTEKQ